MITLICKNIKVLCAFLTAWACVSAAPSFSAAYDQDLPPASIGASDVWTRYGGARLHYLALAGSRQVWSGGALGSDPALLPKLPPLKRWSEKKRVYHSTRKAAPAKTAQAKAASAPPPAYAPLGRPGQGGDSFGSQGPSFSAPAAQTGTPSAVTPPFDPAHKQAGVPAAGGNGISVSKPPVTPQQQLWPSPDNAPVAPRTVTPVTPPAAPAVINGVNTTR